PIDSEQPVQLERAASEFSQPLRFLFCCAARPGRDRDEGLDLDDQPPALPLMSPDAVDPTVDEQDGRDPALRAKDASAEVAGKQVAQVGGGGDDVLVEGGQEPD